MKIKTILSTIASKIITIKLLEENVGVNLHDLGLATSFSDPIPKAQMAKENIDKLEFTKIKNLYC